MPALESVVYTSELGWQFFKRDFAARYRESYLGYFWALAPVLAMTLSLVLAQRAELIPAQKSSTPYAVTAVVGTVLWTTFYDAAMAPSQAVAQAKPLLTKVSFPLLALVIAKVYELLFSVLLRLPLVAGVLLLNGTHTSTSALSALVSLIGCIACGLCVGVTVAAIGGLYNDALHALSFALNALLLATPVFYETARPGSLIAQLNTINPLTYLIGHARATITNGSSDVTLPATLALSAMLLLWPLCKLWLSLMRFAIERLGT